jgi:hypothetical protein
MIKISHQLCLTGGLCLTNDLADDLISLIFPIHSLNMLMPIV